MWTRPRVRPAALPSPGRLVRVACALLLLWSSTPALAACPVDVAGMRSHLDEAWSEYASGHTASFLTRVAAIDSEVGCLSEVLDAKTAARLHLLDGLRAALAKDAVATLASFRGAYAADPTLEPGADIAAPGSRVRDTLEMARVAGGGATRTVVVGEGVVVHVDGSAGTSEVPTERAAVVQIESNGPLRTWSLRGSGTLPPDLISTAQTSVAPSTESVTSLPASTDRKRTSRPLLVTGVATGAVAVGSLVVAQSYKSGFDDVSQESVADDHYVLNRAFGFGGYGLGATAVGFVAAAVIVGEW
jgi:hypothetical protein